ncbi:methionine adenosyltransferase 2 subunit beta-like [Sycon ciliatum]|uniref:methionine adenosyltransferase 2 subunit beta-like n=1 Tax=Sycon ciliatum TaxID=27933 RepID=UPI0031F61CE0
MASNSRRVLVTGGSGLLGRQVVSEFAAHAWTVTGLAFSRISGDLRKVDLRDLAAVQAVLADAKPEVVVHAAAERRPDVVEKQADATEALNVTATRQLASECASRGIYLVYISTDYVFDGTQPPYHCDAKPNPLNSYGRSKLAGEEAVRETANLRGCILRVPVLYGTVETLDESAVTVLLKTVLSKKDGSKVNHVQRRYPTHVNDVAVVCRNLADRSLAGPGGSSAGGEEAAPSGSTATLHTYHWAGNEMLTKYDMAIAMADEFGLETGHLVADTAADTSAVPRPHDCQLDCSAIEALGMGARTPFRRGISAALATFVPK